MHAQVTGSLLNKINHDEQNAQRGKIIAMFVGDLERQDGGLQEMPNEKPEYAETE